MAPTTRSAKKRSAEAENKDFSEPAKKKADEVKHNPIPLSNPVQLQKVNQTVADTPKTVTETPKKASPPRDQLPPRRVGNWRQIEWTNWDKNDVINWVHTFWSLKDDIQILWEKKVDGRMLGKIVEYQMKIRANQELGQTTGLPPRPVNLLSDRGYQMICSSFWTMSLHKLRSFNRDRI